MVGQTIDGRYRLLRILGQGGMGAVYEAEHTGTGRRVAVKVILGTELAKSASIVQRFEREARAAGSIDTQHIVQVLDTGTDPTSGMPYMVMELLRGEDLQSLLLRLGRLPPDLALRLVAQACIGLLKAHEAGVVHRDVKPANLFLARREDDEVVVKVVDFGVAKMKLDVTGSEEVALTRTGNLLGSPLYMSPEQAVGKKSLDHRTDVWSLGAVLYQALLGQVAHAHCETLGSLILAICGEPVRPLQEAAPWVPEEVARLAHRALTIDVSARFQGMGEMLDAIRQILPGSLVVRSAMLVPLSATEQAYLAPRATPAPPMTQAPGGMTGVGTAVANSLTGIHAGSAAGLSVSHEGPPATRSLAPLVAAVAALALGAGGLAFYRLALHPPAGEASAARSAIQAEGAGAVPPSDGATGPAVGPASAARAHTVHLAIEPANAKVEIDGQPAPVKDGATELTGALGSVHHVRLWLDRTETTGDVAISESGALPWKMQLGGLPSRAPGKAPGTGEASPAPAPSAAPKPKNPDMIRTFE